MKFVLLLFAALATGIAMTQLIDNPGYVLISRQPWSIESTLGIFLLALLVLFGLTYLLIRFLINLFHTPARLGRWSHRRQTQQALDAQQRGLAAVITGDYVLATKTLLKNIRNTPNPSINYLAAAWAAQQQNNTEERDSFMASASDGNTGRDIAPGIVRCRLQIQAGQTEQALATASSLQQVEPSNDIAIQMLLKLLEETEDWATLLPMLKTAEKLNALPEKELAETTWRVTDRMLSTSSDLKELDQRIRMIPKKQRRSERIVASMARAMNHLGDFDRSETMLRTALKNDWSELLISLYGETRSSDPCAQLKYAETLTTDHPLSTALMLTLGRLAMRSQLWGMARSYLEVAIHNNDNADAFLEMGWLLETLNEGEPAREMFRRGLELKTGNSRDQSIPDQIKRISTTSDESNDSSAAQAPSLVYSKESK